MKLNLTFDLKKLKIDKFFANFVYFISFLMIFSAIIYFFYALNYLGLILSIILSIISLIILNKFYPDLNKKEIEITEEQKFTSLNKNNYLILITWFLFLLACLNELFMGRSTQALLSPWEIVSTRFFFFFLLNSGLLIFITLKTKLSKNIKLFLISVHYLLLLSIAVIIYKIGYGYDPFIHEATMELISKNGFVTPKTPYYLGQYGLIVALNKFLGISIALLNKLLTPFLAALLLPKAIYKFSQKLFFEKKLNFGTPWLNTIIILSFLAPLFIITTPQNLSYIFIILALLNGLNEEKNIKTLIFSLTAAAIHPLAGIPALIWSAWLILKKYTENRQLNNYLLNAITILLGIFSTPLALYFVSGQKLNSFKLDFESIIFPLFNFFKLDFAGQENWLLNLIYLLQKNYTILILLLIMIGFVFFLKNKAQFKSVANIQGSLIIGASLFFSFIISSEIVFSNLIIYEQDGYAKRILIISLLFISPLIISVFNKLIDKILNNQTFFVKIIWLFIILTLLGSNLYLSYPRFDKYHNSRGYSTSAFDLEAVEKIEKLSLNKKYLVLANQQVSAAALKTFGFNNYYNSVQGPIYFYPIPTGGPLYQYYLKMVYDYPSRKTAYSALDLVNLNELYLVINKYWHESDKIIKAAKVEADNWYEIGNQEIFIFQYLK